MLPEQADEMDSDFIDPQGIIVPPASLQLRRARLFAETVWRDRLDFVFPVECWQNQSPPDGDGTETVVLDVEVERPQRRKHDIQRVERIAVRFSPEDNWYPEVLALRRTFPRVPHTNLRPEEIPRSLCLYDQPWEQVSLRWTPAACIDRIRFWLAETAKGTLHQTDQPLEPLFFGSGLHIVFPADLFSATKEVEYEELQVSLPMNASNGRVFFAARGEAAPGLLFVALSFVADPQSHGTIHRQPKNLHDLDGLLKAGGIQLLDCLRRKLPGWSDKELRSKRLLLVVAFPLMRDGQQNIEVTDLWAFLTPSSITDIGIAIGLWEKLPGGESVGQVLQRDPGANGSTVSLDVVSPHLALTREKAAASSGFAADPRRVLAIGAGAIGSQVVNLLARTGFGNWSLVDEDVLLPHNLARHALGAESVGFPKVLPLAFKIDALYGEQGNLLHGTAIVGQHGQEADELFDLRFRVRFVDIQPATVVDNLP